MKKVLFDPTIPPLLLQNLVLQHRLDTTPEVHEAAWADHPTDGEVACLISALGRVGLLEVVVD